MHYYNGFSHVTPLTTIAMHNYDVFFRDFDAKLKMFQRVLNVEHMDTHASADPRCVSQVVEINAVELDMCTLLSDQAEALLDRRRQAVREESTRLQLQACE